MSMCQFTQESAAALVVGCAQVAGGKLGKKTGEGFYRWSADGKKQA